MSAAPLPYSREARDIALGHVTAAVIAAMGQGADVPQVSAAAQRGIDIIRQRVAR